MTSKAKLQLKVLKGSYSVCKPTGLDEMPDLESQHDLLCIVRTRNELSIVCATEQAHDFHEREDGWKALRIVGALDFSQIGVIRDLTVPLADASISVFVVSTFDTDYLLVKEIHLERALDALSRNFALL